MEAFWTIPLFALPILTIIYAVLGIRNYRISKQKKHFRKPILFFAITVSFTMLLFYITADTIKHTEQNLIGNFRSSDSSATHLQLLENHRFVLENKINDDYNGIGNWEINLDSHIMLILEFDTGSNLEFVFSPGEMILLGKTESKQDFTLYKVN